MEPGWQHTEIQGKRLDYFPTQSNPRFVLLDLHPVGGDVASDNPIWTRELTRRQLACVVPYGQQSWWSDRLCPRYDPATTAEAHLLEQVLPWIQQQWGIEPPRIALTGISMGGQGALRLGFKHPKRFPVVAGIASALEYNVWFGQGTPIDEMYPSAEHCRQDTAILQINPFQYPPAIWFACDPEDETWYRGNDRLQEKLQAYGIPHTADLSAHGGGHTWDYFNTMIPMMLDFVQTALEKESRRLV